MAIFDAIGKVSSVADPVVWGVDVTGTISGLLLALLAAHRQQVEYVPGRTVNRMATAYQGEAKTDERDAYVIAETIPHRHDLTDVEVPVALVTELRLLVAHRTDLVADRVRMVDRLRTCSRATSRPWSARSTTPTDAGPPCQARTWPPTFWPESRSPAIGTRCHRSWALGWSLRPAT